MKPLWIYRRLIILGCPSSCKACIDTRTRLHAGSQPVTRWSPLLVQQPAHAHVGNMGLRAVIAWTSQTYSNYCGLRPEGYNFPAAQMSSFCLRFMCAVGGSPCFLFSCFQPPQCWVANTRYKAHQKKHDDWVCQRANSHASCICNETCQSMSV